MSLIGADCAPTCGDGTRGRVLDTRKPRRTTALQETRLGQGTRSANAARHLAESPARRCHSAMLNSSKASIRRSFKPKYLRTHATLPALPCGERAWPNEDATKCYMGGATRAATLKLSLAPSTEPCADPKPPRHSRSPVRALDGGFVLKLVLGVPLKLGKRQLTTWDNWHAIHGSWRRLRSLVQKGRQTQCGEWGESPGCRARSD